MRVREPPPTAATRGNFCPAVADTPIVDTFESRKSWRAWYNVQAVD